MNESLRVKVGDTMGSVTSHSNPTSPRNDIISVAEILEQIAFTHPLHYDVNIVFMLAHSQHVDDIRVPHTLEVEYLPSIIQIHFVQISLLFQSLHRNLLHPTNHELSGAYMNFASNRGKRRV